MDARPLTRDEIRRVWEAIDRGALGLDVGSADRDRFILAAGFVPPDVPVEWLFLTCQIARSVSDPRMNPGACPQP